MKWIGAAIVLLLLVRWLRHGKPIAREEYGEPPEFVNIAGRPRNPDQLIEQARRRGVIN